MGANSPRIMILKPEDASLGGTFFFQEQHVQLKSLDAQWITVFQTWEQKRNNAIARLLGDMITTFALSNCYRVEDKDLDATSD